jgi:hypothetical protein
LRFCGTRDGEVIWISEVEACVAVAEDGAGCPNKVAGLLEDSAETLDVSLPSPPAASAGEAICIICELKNATQQFGSYLCMSCVEMKLEEDAEGRDVFKVQIRE